MTTSDAKVCESCGEPFGCGAKLDGCWCAEVELDPVVLDKLKTIYNDCLCPRCLEALAKADKTEPNEIL